MHNEAAQRGIVMMVTGWRSPAERNDHGSDHPF